MNQYQHLDTKVNHLFLPLLKNNQTIQNSHEIIGQHLQGIQNLDQRLVIQFNLD